MTIDRFHAARAAHKRYARGLVARGDVNAVSVGLRSVGGADTDEPCVTAWVDRKLPAGALSAARLLPTKLPIAAGETRLDVRESTRLVAPAGAAPSVIGGGRSTVAATRERLRPIQGGVSGASFRFPIGTLTCVVADAIDPGQQFLLSCNHVLADVNAGSVGDPVLQPAFSDGGNAGDTVAWLARWMPLSFVSGGANYVDAAVALVPAGTCLPDVVGAGRVAGVRSAASLEPGEAVRKVGRTSGMTNETVLGTDADVWVTYRTASGLRQALFTQQILTTACAAYGDSGSPLLDADNRIVGMLFSGTAQTTAFNPFAAIETMLGVRYVATP
jgi:hypothetical protein